MMENNNGLLAQTPEPRAHDTAELKMAVEQSLPILRNISAVLDVYGIEKVAGDLRRAIDLLEVASHSQEHRTQSLDFVVNARFSVKRSRVANLLMLGYEGSSWQSIVGQVMPQELLFRAVHDRIVEEVDYPLNVGGYLSIAVAEKGPESLRLDLQSVTRGLDALATKYPRHFADFLAAAEDRITGSIFLQCCLFGEIVFE